MKSIILVSILAVAYCMPHNINPSGNTKPSVEIEKQVVVELTSSTGIPPNSPPKREEIDETTREILAKIEQVNIKQGYVTTKNSATRTISEFPHYYLYSYEQPKPMGKYVYDIPQSGVANSEQTKDEHVHDHHPKRKISQQQMYLIPVTNFAATPQLIVTPVAELPKFYYDTQTAQNSNNDLRDVLERKTVDNIKDIVVKSQLPPNILSSTYFNPLVQNLPYYSPPIYNGYPTQNFPIIQNSPAVMVNSVTTIEEYDKTSCNTEKRIGKELPEESDDDDDDDNHQTNGDVEVRLDNLIVTNFPATKSRTEKEVQGKSKQRPQKPILVFHQAQQNADQYLKPEFEDEAEVENEKDKAVQTNDKKFFSKDNVGDGIFIRRLKVRKGGVAIAGPGGIATAGSGGTAIVGPNGWAYTHPDSLAIAGSGTKVIAVDPNIKLGDLIKPNVTRKGVLNTRIGKVVAVGPVIYYNRG